MTSGAAIRRAAAYGIDCCQIARYSNAAEVHSERRVAACGVTVVLNACKELTVMTVAQART